MARKMKNEDLRKLWDRKLSCGHTRPTNLAFFSGNYTEPEIGEECYCRECMTQEIVVGVEECLNRNQKKFIDDCIEHLNKQDKK